jgi:hypothetical protein
MGNDADTFWNMVERLYKIQGKISYDDIRGMALQAGFFKRRQVDNLIHDGESSGKLMNDPTDMYYYHVVLCENGTFKQTIEEKAEPKNLEELYGWYSFFRWNHGHPKTEPNSNTAKAWLEGHTYEVKDTGITAFEFYKYAEKRIATEGFDMKEIQKREKIVKAHIENKAKEDRQRNEDAAKRMLMLLPDDEPLTEAAEKANENGELKFMEEKKKKEK